jgi:hypothetical protein
MANRAEMACNFPERLSPPAVRRGLKYRDRTVRRTHRSEELDGDFCGKREAAPVAILSLDVR